MIETELPKKVMEKVKNNNNSPKIEELDSKQTLRYNLVIEYMKQSTLVMPDADTIINNAMKTEHYVLTGKKD